MYQHSCSFPYRGRRNQKLGLVVSASQDMLSSISSTEFPSDTAQVPAYGPEIDQRVYSQDFDFAMGYLDDIIIFSKTEEEHLRFT